MTWYAHAADRYRGAVTPHRRPLFGDPPDPGAGAPEAMAWFDAERANLLVAVRCAHAEGLDDLTWVLPFCLDYFYDRRAHWDDWIEGCRLGLASADRSGDIQAQARMLNGLGTAHREAGRPAEALPFALRAVEAYELLDYPRGLGATVFAVGATYQALGDDARAVEWFERALPLWHRAGHSYGIVTALNQLGLALHTLGRYAEAVDRFRAALAVCATEPLLFAECATLDSLGATYGALGRVDEATDCFLRAVGLARELGDARSEAACLGNLAAHLHAHGATGRAAGYWLDALRLTEQWRLPGADAIRARLA